LCRPCRASGRAETESQTKTQSPRTAVHRIGPENVLATTSVFRLIRKRTHTQPSAGVIDGLVGHVGNPPGGNNLRRTRLRSGSTLFSSATRTAPANAPWPLRETGLGGLVVFAPRWRGSRSGLCLLFGHESGEGRSSSEPSPQQSGLGPAHRNVMQLSAAAHWESVDTRPAPIPATVFGASCLTRAKPATQKDLQTCVQGARKL